MVVGSVEYPGAAILAVGAAARTGIGMLRYVGPEPVSHQVLAAWPEVVLGPGQVDAWVLGCGVSANATDQLKKIDELMMTKTPKVVDAGALSRADWSSVQELTCILTPHAGELSRLLDSMGKHCELDYEAVGLAARLTRQVVVLKGNTTLIADPDGEVRSVGPNPTGLATAGTGDVLAGIAGALCAANPDAALIDVAELAVQLHSEAARLAAQKGTFVAHDLIDELRGVVANWQS